MKLKLENFSLYPASLGEAERVGANLSIEFDGDLQISGGIGLTFPQEGAANMSFTEIEKIAIAKALAALA